MRSIKILVFLLLFSVFLLPSQAEAAAGIPILTYHYVDYNPNKSDTARDALSVTPDKFDAQMEYLSKNGYEPISLDTLYAIFNKQAARPAKPVVLTFDDGYENFYRVVYPILKKYNFRAVAFIPTGLIGTGYYMNWDQIKEIQASGLVTFEGHSSTHPNLIGMKYDAVYKQLLDSKNTLFSQTGYPVNFVAYPYGSSNKNVWSAAQKSGYVGGVGTWYGKATGPSMNMPRIKVSGTWNISQFASRL